MARSTAGESVIARAARVLDAFEHDRRVLTVAEIARRTRLPVPTAHRLVAQMLDAGLLDHEEPHRVRVGMRLWEIGVLGARALDLREAAMPYLQDVHAVTRQYTHLTVLDGPEIVVIERLKAVGAIDGVPLQAGRRVPANAQAGGLVMLAHADKAVQDRLLGRPLVRYNDRTPASEFALRRIWEAARRQGFLVCDGFIDARVVSIAVPVSRADGTVVAAIGVIVPSAADAPPMTHVPVLLAAARAINRALCDPAPPGRTRLPRYVPPC